MENNILLSSSLISEINKFRRISSLPLVEISESKNKTLLVEADRSKLLYQIALDLTDDTSIAANKRAANLMDIFQNNRLFFNAAGERGTAKEIKLARENFIADIERMVKSSSGIDEIVEFIEKKLGKNFDEFEAALVTRIDDTVKQDLRTELKAENSTTKQMITSDFTSEVQRRMEQVATQDPLVKAKLINMMKEEFKKAYQKLLGLEDSELKMLDDILDPIVVNQKKLLYNAVSLSVSQEIMQFLRTSPKVIADLSEIINLFYLSFSKTQQKLTDEINDLVLSIESGAVANKNGGVLIADRVKVLIRTQKTIQIEIGSSFEKLYNDLMTKIKDSISDEKLKTTILSKIEEIETSTGKLDPETGKYVTGPTEKINVLKKFFDDLDSAEYGTANKDWVTLKQKLSEFFSFAQNPFGKTLKDNVGNIFKRTEGWGTRWATFFITGTLSTFREYVEEMGKTRRGFLGNVRGWGSRSVMDMFIRIWLRANLFVPMVLNLFMGIFGAIWACTLNTVGDKSFNFAGTTVGGDNSIFNLVEDTTYKKYCQTPMKTFFQETYNDILDTFTPIQELINIARGEDSKIDTGSKLGNAGVWFMEVFDMILPFNSKLDDLVYWLFTDPKERIKKTLDDSNKEDTESTNKTFKESDPKAYAKKMQELGTRKLSIVGAVSQENISKAQEISSIMTIDSLNRTSYDPVFLYNGSLYYLKANPRKGVFIYSDKDGYEYTPDEFIKNNMNESRYKKIKNMITENDREKFGEDNFKHWKDTFIFKSQDEKNPGQYKEVKITMDDVMDRIDHYRKKYDEDDAFVRAVIDTHDDVVKVMYTKDLADIHESATPRGLALVLRTIKESRGEMEIFSVARPANGNWFLVKGDYTPNQLANMDLEKKEPVSKEKEVVTKAEDDLKKKEESAISILKRNEKEGIEELPKKVRDKIKEKMGKGWTTETPPEELKEFFTTSEINSIFNDKIVIYKLEPTREFFDSLIKNSARIVIKRGFCRALESGNKGSDLSERQKMTVNHILNKCNTKYENKLGLRKF